jgi:lysophospholipase L1-like esterase
VNIDGGEHIVFCGDSRTNLGWFNDALTAIAATFAAHATTKQRFSVNTGAPGKIRPGAAPGQVQAVTNQKGVTFVNSGVSGNVTADIAAAVPARITNLNPTMLVLWVGINDLINANSLAAFTASYQSILTQTLAAIPTCKIVTLGMWLRLEQWILSGGVPVGDNPLDPPPSNPTYTPSLAQYDAAIQAATVAVGGVFVQPRPDTITYWSVHNTPAPGAISGILSVDGLHQNATGAALLSDHFLAAVPVQP